MSDTDGKGQGKMWGYGGLGGYGGGGGDNKGKDTFVTYQHHIHDAVKPIMIGGHPVHLGRRPDLTSELVASMDVICPLNGQMPPTKFGSLITTVSCELQDFGGVPKGFNKFIENIANQIVAGKRVLGYCTGGHGRTGTFGAALIALLEPKIVDPIAEIRKRHCKKAVETIKQADAVFGIKGGLAPQNYEDEFKKPKYAFQTEGNQSQYHKPSEPKTSPIWEKDPDNPGKWRQKVYDAVKSVAVAVSGGNSKKATREEVEGHNRIMTGDVDGEWYMVPGRGMVQVSDADDLTALSEEERDYLALQHGIY